MLSTELKSQIQGAYSQFLEAKGLKPRYGQRLMIAEVAKVLGAIKADDEGRRDGEPAIVAVREALARCHGGLITPEQPPRGEHQANGAAEEAGRTVRDHARVLKIDLQRKIKRNIAPTSRSCRGS